MAIPSVNLFSNAPGGGLVTAMGAMNTLAHNMLKRKYYAPDMESQINNRNALTEGQTIQNQYMPDKLRLANALADLHNQYYGSDMESQINNRNALTDKYNTMTPLEAKQLELKNTYYPEVAESNILAQKAMANLRNAGGAGMGVGQKELRGFENQLAQDHPEWTPEEINQAANSYLTGDNVSLDGSPLPPLGGKAESFLNQIAKRGTTAPIITSGIKANQAEAELEVLNKYANEGLKPYGTTFFNKSPQQVLDTFKSDSASQKRLGRFIASQALQFEIAQNRIKLANGQPGVTSTQELMHLSRQTIKDNYPRLTQEAREETTRYMDEALKKGLEARQSVNTGAAGLKARKNTNKKFISNIDLSKYDIPDGYIGLVKDGEQYFFPPNLINKKLNEGYSYE